MEEFERFGSAFGGAGHQEEHITAALAFGEGAVHGEVVHQPLGGIDAVAVLVVVSGVIGIRHQEHVVVGLLGAQS